MASHYTPDDAWKDATRDQVPPGGYVFAVHVPISGMVVQVQEFVRAELERRWPAARLVVGPFLEPDNHHNAAACPYCLGAKAVGETVESGEA